MPAPQINVRLTADGVQDVVNAFRRVQQETRKTKEETGLLGEAMSQLKGLIPVITIGAVVGKMIEMGKASFDSAVNLGKLAEKTGASAGDLSVLAMAAHDADVNQETLSVGLGKLSKNMYEAAHGTGTAKEAFASLGVSLKDIKSKNTSDMFVEIAQKMAALPDGPKKAALAIELFGRSGQNLIPLIDEIGQANGFEVLRAKCQKFGLYISDDMARQIEEANGSLKDMEDVAHGFANMLLVGLSPAINGVTSAFAGMSNGGNVWVEIGRQIGLEAIQDAAIFMKLATFLRLARDEYVDWKEGINAADYGVNAKIGWTASDRADQAKKRDQALSRQHAAVVDHDAAPGEEQKFYARLREAKKQLDQMGTSPSTNHNAGQKGGKKDYGMDGNGISAADAKKRLEEYQKLIEARANFEDALGNAELEKQKTRDELAEIQDKARYNAGLMTLKEYYDARAKRIQAETAAEEKLLHTKLESEEAAAAKLLGKSPAQVKTIAAGGTSSMEASVAKLAPGTQEKALSMLQKVAQTQAQIDETAIKGQVRLAESEDQRHAAAKDANDKLIADRQKLYQLTGDTAKAQQIALDKELFDTDELLKRLGVAESERTALLQKVRKESTAKNAFSAGMKSSNATFDDMQYATEEISNKAPAGAISEVDAEVQIRKEEESRLPALREIASELQAQLDKLDPQTDTYKELKKQLDDYKKNIDSISVKLNTVKTFSVELSNQMSTTGVHALTTFFDDFGSGSKSFSDSMEDMGETFEKVIEHMISQMIVYYTLMSVIGWISPNSTFLKSLSSKGPFGFSEGGYTGNGSTTAVAGAVHGKEYVLNANATSKYGVAFLDAMNKGTVGFVTSIGSYSGLNSEMAAATSSSDSSPAVEVNVQNNSGQTATTTKSTGSNGQSVIDIVIGKVAQDIANGGRVGQAMQSNYGVTRKGVVRG